MITFYRYIWTHSFCDAFLAIPWQRALIMAIAKIVYSIYLIKYMLSLLSIYFDYELQSSLLRFPFLLQAHTHTHAQSLRMHKVIKNLALANVIISISNEYFGKNDNHRMKEQKNRQDMAREDIRKSKNHFFCIVSLRNQTEWTNLIFDSWLNQT